MRLGNGTNSKAVGCSVVRNSPGKYTCNLNVARPDNNYVIQLTALENGNTDDIIITIDEGGQLTTEFTYTIREEDNGTSPGALVDKDHMIALFDS